LLKANICRLPNPKLKGDGFNVVNNGSRIYFPSMGDNRIFIGSLR